MQGLTPTVTVRHRTHVARIYPTTAQRSVLDSQGHTARAIWNLLHEWYTCGNGGIARRPSVAEVDRQLRVARNDPLPGWEWIAELPAQATQQVLRHYLRTWDRHYEGTANPPKPKKRNGRLAVDVPQASQLRVTRLGSRWGEVTIPLAGRIRFRWTRPVPGVARGCPGRITGGRLIKNALGWSICFRIEEAIEVSPNTSPPVGIDRGVAHTMSLSDGRNLDMPSLLRPGERRRLRKLELQAARRYAARQPGMRVSNREHRTYDQIAALRARQARRRTDWLHKKTTDLARQHEDLRIKSMTRSARGTHENPGTNVRAKSGLNRSILEMAWGTAERMLAYKCLWRAGVLITVRAEYSSQTCARCGELADESRPSRGWFSCVTCGHRAPADTNAAQVVLARGLAALSGTAPGHGVAGRGALASGQAMKRQPPEAAMGHTLLSGSDPCRSEQEGCQKPVTMTCCEPWSARTDGRPLPDADSAGTATPVAVGWRPPARRAPRAHGA
jgi:putative transposase